MSQNSYDNVFEAKAYTRVYCEDGAYDACVGYNVFVRVVNEAEGYTDVYGYCGRRKHPGSEVFEPLHVFNTEEDCTKFVNRVLDRGSVNLDDFWVCVERSYHNAVPDYVTNWWRPEYN